ncbi:hypothetical protein BH23PLA1_BH23PLA1_10690 [soil metagenome]
MPAVSIRYAGPLLFVLPVLVVVVAFGLLASWQGGQLVEVLTGRIVAQATSRVEDQLNSYLATAENMTDQTAAMLADGTLNPARLRDWRPDLFRQLSAFKAVSSIVFGNVEGEATWMIRYPGELDLEYAIKDAQTGEDLVEYRVGTQGEPTERITSNPFDPRQRPWYQAALEAGGPTWSAVYSWVRHGDQNATLGLAFTRPIQDTEGQLVGVLAADVGLLDVSRFLKHLRITESGRVYLIGPEGDLLAASTEVPVTGLAGERVKASESDDRVLKFVASWIESDVGTFSAIQDRRLLVLRIEGDRHRVEIEPWENPWGLDWKVLAVVPDGDVIGGLQALRTRTWLIGGLVAACALALGMVAARSIVRPVLALVEGVRTIGDGDFDHRIRVDGVQEFERLSEEVNRMAEGLKDRLRLRHSMALAMEIQQKLLPGNPPQIPGLDVAGHSTYCDETGGDYYDFLELEETTSGDLIVVLGDVMGHGLAAALLMATARGILRSRATEPGTLGELLTHVNRLLESDTGGERFMTMILLIVDAQNRSIRWSSAGHDSPIVYNPEQDQFLDLPNINGLPLGLLDDSEYQEAIRSGLAPGQIILVGTDGIWETRNAEDQEFGKSRLQQTIRAHREEPSQRIAEAITEELRRFRGDAHQDDDITFVLIKFT